MKNAKINFGWPKSTFQLNASRKTVVQENSKKKIATFIMAVFLNLMMYSSIGIAMKKQF